MMTLQELEKIHGALILVRRLTHVNHLEAAVVNDALEIIYRKIDQLEQDELLSVSKANPT